VTPVVRTLYSASASQFDAQFRYKTPSVQTIRIKLPQNACLDDAEAMIKAAADSLVIVIGAADNRRLGFWGLFLVKVLTPEGQPDLG